MKQTPTLEEKINQEYWRQHQEISNCRDEIWDASPVEHYTVIRRAYHSAKTLYTWVSDAIADPDQIIAFYQERYAPPRHLIGWGSTADYCPLVWKQYGYDGYKLPDWYHDAIWKAELASILARPADVRYRVEYVGGTTFAYSIWDAANPFYTPWDMRVRMVSADPARAEDYVRREYEKHKRLHVGGVNCLIHFHATGQAAMPYWMPDGQLNLRDAKGKVTGQYPRLIA
jgi:hypothetical protein